MSSTAVRHSGRVRGPTATLLLLAAVAGNPAAAERETNSLDDKIVDLTCPAEDDGTLTVILRDSNGRATTAKVRYRGSQNHEEPFEVYIRYEGAEMEGKWEHRISLLERLSNADSTTANKAITLANKMLQRICNASDSERVRFEQWLAKNREEIDAARD